MPTVQSKPEERKDDTTIGITQNPSMLPRDVEGECEAHTTTANKNKKTQNKLEEIAAGKLC